MGRSGSNLSDEEDRIIDFGRQECHPPFADNSVSTAKFTLLTFLPLAIRDQFRRNGNVYFLCMGLLMAVGYYTSAFDTSITPWTTLGPLALVVSVSLAQEGYTDLKRHRSDKLTNYHPCVVLRRADDLDGDVHSRKRDNNVNGGKDVTVRIVSKTESSDGTRRSSKKMGIAFESVYRLDIRAGDLVVARNREMIPADLILLASSNEGGSAYIETSSIDGETNLKLRNSPQIAAKRPGLQRMMSSSSLFNAGQDGSLDGSESSASRIESLRHAVERVANISLLGHPDGVSALLNPANASELNRILQRGVSKRTKGFFGNILSCFREEEKSADASLRDWIPKVGARTPFIATLTSEPPNTHVNSFSGKLTLPPDSRGSRSEHAALNAENILLRGAILRNTEWIIGIACFTGADTKLVMNSVATPSKFSQLDRLINRTVFLILFIMMICVITLGAASVSTNNAVFDTLWFAGYNSNTTEPWPYFNLEGSIDIEPPDWSDQYSNYGQMVFLFITMLSNFVPLSLYVSVEIITVMMMLYVGWDLSMYHGETDTPAAARSTIVTDLGLVEYIFSDKTGTLTCNVMEFKRCSVDGHVFGMPVAKAAPRRESSTHLPESVKDDDSLYSDSIHPLKHLLAGPTRSSGSRDKGERDEASTGSSVDLTNRLSFNAEMFLRVMSICHTVVVEKDHSSPAFDKSANGSKQKKSWGLRSPKESDSNTSTRSPQKGKKKKKAKSKKADGAPEGYAYQAESPDEGALVSAASSEYGFQLLGRDSSGVQISCPRPSLFEDKKIIKGVKSGKLSAKILASQTSSRPRKYSSVSSKSSDGKNSSRHETWAILAINKFDSDRKRMSVLVRSPSHLGSIPMLLCKGADSSMLAEGVCEGFHLLQDMNRDEEASGSVVDSSEIASLLSIQAHLGEFASEGLRTLVLGVKILTESEADQWLSKFREASTSIDNRSKKLTSVAYEIEKNLHIVGATAIEDKLQEGVPETIANLGQAGIKLWVLTGDKRETAIEIGYSTKVLTPKMHLTEVVDGPAKRVKILLAMELMRHIKIGNLPDYQLSILDEPKDFSWKSIRKCLAAIGHWRRMLSISIRRIYLTKVKILWISKTYYSELLEILQREAEAEKRRHDPKIQRRKVRDTAKAIIKDFWNNPKNAQLRKKLGRAANNDDGSLVPDEPPAIFERARSARASLASRRQNDTVSELPTIQKLALAKVSASNRDLFDEEALSMSSFNPSHADTNFDKKKRTVMERMFAVDSDVRHGRLKKHLKEEYREALALDEKEQVGREEMISMVSMKSSFRNSGRMTNKHFDLSAVTRGLVVEGAALKHLLGDPVLEEMLFAVASCCDSVIACRVSPLQKALLLKMVRKYVSPTPTTLAIGDGANDVGMIQEAHVGVGISGLEGQQAVNASDFAIAQFRYLETLLLIHGRWNFMRMSKVVLFFFYKNSVLIGTLIIFSGTCLHSGTILYDPWVLAVFNFVGGSLPIIFMGIFDRDLPRDYVLRNPQVYQSGPRNEFLSFRMTFRWIFITVIHALTIYHFTAPLMYLGGGVTSAFSGLMGNVDRDTPGDGEGGGLIIFGTTIYSNLIYVVTFKALFETRSLIHGEFPTFTCRGGVGEGWPNRMGYTWVGLTWGAILFYIWFLYMYQFIGRRGPSTFFEFIYVTEHLLNMRSMTWIASMLAPTIACIFDVTGKVYGNMYFPTQTQIHSEIASRSGDI